MNVRWFLFAMLICIGLVRPVHAQDEPWTEEQIEALGKPSTEPPPPPGSKITSENWQKYKDYLPYAMQSLFKGDHHFKFPAGDPDYEITVSPTTVLPAPSSWLAATEKYGGQAELVTLPKGGLGYKNYTTGTMFPDPQEPHKATKIIYNAWSGYQPHVGRTYSYGILTDRYGDMTEQSLYSAVYKLDHLSDAGYPTSDPDVQGILLSYINFFTEPEQSKYLAAITRSFDDPDAPTDSYDYIPSLRRALRVSGAAQCAPALGTDELNEDASFVGLGIRIGWYDFKLLGEKKMVSVTNAPADPWRDPMKYMMKSKEAVAKAGMPWPAPNMLRYEVRDTYVILARDLPAYANEACYGSRVIYVDKAMSSVVYHDLFDKDQKFWKGYTNMFVAQQAPEQEGFYDSASFGFQAAWDVQNSHFTEYFGYAANFDHKAGEYQNTARYCTPAGLQEIMQ